MGKKNKLVKKNDLQKKTILNQIKEIEKLKKEILDLQIDCHKKDDLLNIVNSFQNELSQIIDDLQERRKQYDILISDLQQMKCVMNQQVFKGRWNIIKALLY